MSEIIRVSTSDRGLDLVLGGGLCALRRGAYAEPSGSLLIRGGAGAGKTVLSLQIAMSVAKRLGGDVVYGCVELLPVELQAQQASMWSAGALRIISADAEHEPPFAGVDPSASHVLAGLLDLGTGEHEHEHLGDAVLGLLTASRASGARPKVLVIDSLVHGYGLAATTPRAVSDGLVKLAADEGLFLILAEEAGADPGQWRFAVDTVLELEHGPQRRLSVVKHRFAASEVGPHPYVIQARHGLRCLPIASAYLSGHAREVLEWASGAAEHAWGFRGAESLPPPSGLIAVCGDDPSTTRAYARLIAAGAPGSELVFDWGAGSPESGATTAGSHDARFVVLSDPDLQPEMFLALAREALDDCGHVARVVIGDLAALTAYAHAGGLRRAILTLAEALRRTGVPAVVFESERLHLRSTLVGWADLSVDVRESMAATHFVTIRDRAGRRVELPRQQGDLVPLAPWTG